MMGVGRSQRRDGDGGGNGDGDDDGDGEGGMRGAGLTLRSFIVALL